jgi:hypothetical protein
MNVQGPNGAIVAFPDGTDPATVDSVMRQNFSAPSGATTPSPVAPPAAPVDPRAAFAALPWYGKAAQAADDTVRNVVNGATFGYADKIAAAANGLFTGQDPAAALAAERQQSSDAMARAGSAGVADNLLGMAAPAGMIGKAVGAVGAAAPALPLVGRVLANPWTQAAATGAAVGDADSAGHDQPVTAGGTVLNAGLGLAGKGVADAATGALGALAGTFNPTIAAPSADALRMAAQSQYAASENAGLVLNNASSQDLANKITGTMVARAYDPVNEPGGQAVLNTLGRFANIDPYAPPASPFRNPTAGPTGAPAAGPPPLMGASLAQLDSLRQVAGRMAQGPPSSASLGNAIVKHIDDHIDGLQPSDVVMGDLPGGVAALQNARDLWQRSVKGQQIQDAQTAASNNAAATGSGGNINNATRQQAKALLNSATAWSPDERDALSSIIQGTPTANAARLLGKLSPSGNGLMFGLHLGGMATGALTGGGTGAALGMIPAIVGATAKTAGDRLTTSAMDNFGALARSGGVASALNPQNAVQTAAAGAANPLGAILTNAGITASLNNADQNSKAAQLAKTLSTLRPAPSGGLGDAFAPQNP